MKTYHVVYFPDNQTVYSRGVNIEAESMLEALTVFMMEYNIEPYYIAQK